MTSTTTLITLELPRPAKLKQEAIVRYKRKKGCKRCGEHDPVCLSLDHRDPATKDPRLRHNQNLRHFSWRDLKAELKKCDVLCFNCHARVERERGEGVNPTSATVQLSIERKDSWPLFT